MSDLISIITPAYNAKSFICNAVESVLNQTHSHWELLIVSDDGVDYQQHLRTHNIQDDRIRFFSTNARQSGPNVGRNVGLSAAKGNWIAPLDADDIYYPTRLEKLLRAAQATGLALDNVWVTSGKDYTEKELVLDVAPGQFGFTEFERSLVPLLLLFRKDLISRGWDEDVIRGADTLFNLRALEKAGYAVLVDEALHEYRVHNASMCHAPGSDQLFIEAYQHTLARLLSDGLGFETDSFRNKVIHMIAEKERINSEFNQAIEQGYTGNYQEFVAEVGLR